MKRRKLDSSDYLTIIHALHILRRDIEFINADGRASGIFRADYQDLMKTLTKVERLYYFSK